MEESIYKFYVDETTGNICISVDAEYKGEVLTTVLSLSAYDTKKFISELRKFIKNIGEVKNA
jgi:translation initiation factor 1 (eIF-1/SUI1)